MLKKIIFCIIAFFVVIPKSHAVMQDFFCKELNKQIILIYIKKNLDVVNNGEYDAWGINFKTRYNFDKDDWEFIYDKNNNLTIARVTNINFIENEDFKINDKVIEINGEPLKNFHFEDFEKVTNENKTLKLKISRNLNNKKIVFEKEIKRSPLQSILVTPEIKIHGVKSLDIKNGMYEVNLTYRYAWDEMRLVSIARKIYYDYLKYKNLEPNDGNWWFCDYSLEEFRELTLYDPHVTLLNLIEFSRDMKSEKFSIAYYPPTLENDDDYVEFIKEYKGLGTFTSNFQFKSFPFDAQKLKFNIGFENQTIQEVIFDDNYPLHLYLKEFVENPNLVEWKIKDYDIKFSHQKILNEYTSEIMSIQIGIERNSKYFLFKVLLPIILILCISGSVFWVTPKEIESRLTVSIVCLLALIAYNFVVDNDIPKLAYLTIMDYIILMSYVFSAYPTFETIFVFHHLEKNPKLSSLVDNKSKFFYPVAFILFLVILTFKIISVSPNTIAALRFIN